MTERELRARIMSFGVPQELLDDYGRAIVHRVFDALMEEFQSYGADLRIDASGDQWRILAKPPRDVH